MNPDLVDLLYLCHREGDSTVALLAADYAEQALPNAGEDSEAALRCIEAVRAWARTPTDASLQECKDAAKRADYIARTTARAVRIPYAAGKVTSAASLAASTAVATLDPANALLCCSVESIAALAAGFAVSSFPRHDIRRLVMEQWQLDHTRTAMSQRINAIT